MSETSSQLTGGKILVADDDWDIRSLIGDCLEDAGFEVVSARNGKEAISRVSEDVRVALLDVEMPELSGLDVLHFLRKRYPRIEVVMVTGSEKISDAVAALKGGAFDYVTKPVNFEQLIAVVHKALETANLKAENRELRQALQLPNPGIDFIGDTPGARAVIQAVDKVARLDATVLITGESGVGKGLVARMIHNQGKRSKGALVTVSCTALPSELVEAELFGHEKGAFTGAHAKRRGKVEMADGGTLFLDEVGDMPLGLQPKLLTFLQDRTFYRIGGDQLITSDARVVAATHNDLKTLCAEKRFREDLYFRLNVLPVHIPPLRERRADILLLASHILQRVAERRATETWQLREEALLSLTSYPWPGNVRELENVLERVTAFGESDTIGLDDLPLEIRHPEALHGAKLGPSIGGLSLQEIERVAIQQTLELCGGNKSQAARSLGISEKSIYNKMKRLGLS